MQLKWIQGVFDVLTGIFYWVVLQTDMGEIVAEITHTRHIYDV